MALFLGLVLYLGGMFALMLLIERRLQAAQAARMAAFFASRIPDARWPGGAA